MGKQKGEWDLWLRLGIRALTSAVFSADYAIGGTQAHAKQSRLFTVCVKKKMTPTFGTFYRNVFAAQLYHKLEGFWESEGFFWRALCSYTYKFQNVVQLRLQIFWSCIYAFQSCIVMVKKHSNGNGSHKCASFYWCVTYTNHTSHLHVHNGNIAPELHHQW